MTAEEFVSLSAHCDPDTPIKCGAAVAGKIDELQFLVGRVRTRNPQLAKMVTVNITCPDATTAALKFSREALAKIVGYTANI